MCLKLWIQVYYIYLLIVVDKSGIVTVDLFLKVSMDNDIYLSERDQQFLRQQANYQGRIYYEEVIKDMVLLVNQKSNIDNDQQQGVKSSLIYEWVLRPNNQTLINSIKNNGAINYYNLIKIKKKPQSRMKTKSENFSTKPKSEASSPTHRDGNKSQKENEQLQFEKAVVPDTGRFSNFTQYNKEVQQCIQALGPDLQMVVHKIIGYKQVKNKQTAIDWTKQISAGSKKINLRKNIQNKLFIKSVTSSEKVLQSKDRIRKYMKDNDVDIMHLNAINGVFLDCDEEGTGVITKKQLLMKIAEENLSLPADFLFNLISDLQVESTDMSEDAVLRYENLKNIIEIYNNCPIFLKGDSNNSDNFKGNMDFNRDMNSGYERIDKLFKHIHARIEEKFKDFRHAFRSFDKDFGGSLDFKEFITGMEEIGIKLKLSDYRLVFDAIDYDHQGDIGFNKFCLLNTDRKTDLQKLKQEYQKLQESKSQNSKGSKKPPLPPLSITGQSQDSSKAHPLFGENIPKNKDLNAFSKDIQCITPVQSYMQRRFLKSAHKEGFKTVTDLPDNHSFGMTYSRDHNMVAILTNSYSEDLKRISIEELRQSLAQKKLPTSKPTYAQMIRDKVTKIKYQPLARRNSASLQRTPSSHQKRSGSRNMFLLRGSNQFNRSYCGSGSGSLQQIPKSAKQ